MSECSFPDYLLSGTVLQNWLRNKYNDGTTVVQSKNAHYVFTLPQGAELTAENRREIGRLRTTKPAK